MEYFLPKESFSKKYEFLGTLSSDTQSLNDIHIIVQYSLLNNGEIHGKIIGTDDLYDKLSGLMVSSAPYLKLNFEKTELRHYCISSEEVFLSTIRRQSTFLDGAMNFDVAEIEFNDITVVEYFNSDAFPERHLSFFLCGPKTMWGISSMRSGSYLGDVTIEVLNKKMDLNIDSAFEVEVFPWHFHENKSMLNDYDITTEVLVLNMKTTKPTQDFSNEDFINRGKKLAEDLILLVSFMSKQWITWYRYQLVAGGVINNYIRRSRACSTEKIDFNKTLVDLSKSRDFLKKGVDGLQRLRTDGLDIRMPLVHYISGNESKYAEEQFFNLFLSLEKIKDMYATKEKLLKNLPEKEFKKIKSIILKIVEEKINSEKTAKRIKNKLVELNRPSLRFVLEAIFAKYGISWEDIYPPNQDFTLVKTRDLLMHSSKDIPLEVFHKELVRLRSIVERILLSMLGWNDFSRSPDNYDKRWLIKPDRSGKSLGT